MRIQVGAFPDGPMSEERRFHPAVDTTLPVQVLVLQRTCDLSGVIAGADGNPFAEKEAEVWLVYDDGETESHRIRTDGAGRFDLKGRIRARSFAIRIDGGGGSGRPAPSTARPGPWTWARWS